MSSTGSNLSDSFNSKDSSSDDDSYRFRPQVSKWYDVSKQPEYRNIINHPSDSNPYEEYSSDEEEKELSEKLEQNFFVLVTLSELKL